MGNACAKVPVNGSISTKPVSVHGRSTENDGRRRSSSMYIRQPGKNIASRKKEVMDAATAQQMMKAAVLIQKWYRRWKARLEARRHFTWRIFTSLEYASESDQLKLYDFFHAIIMQMDSDKDASNLKKKIIDATMRRQNSIAEEDMILYKTVNTDGIKIDAQYTGPHVQWPMTKDQFIKILEAFRENELMHPRYVIEILLETRSALKKVSNVSTCSSQLAEVTVVGDLHGQLEDLLMIFYKNGLPSISNSYVFNGDFVDRGSKSVEVTLVLFLAFLTFPQQIFLNRGNHEDHIVNIRYGFVKEVMDKYKGTTNQILTGFKEVFSWLPLATVIDQQVLVMHGGLSDKTSVVQMNKVDRHKYLSALKPTLGEDALKQILENKQTPELIEWRLVLDTLWSDPQATMGCKPNTHRGGGCYWGPDVTTKILHENKLALVIRSHECKVEGFEFMHDDRVLTVFSASNYYSHGSNKGAYIKLERHNGTLVPRPVQFMCVDKSRKVTMTESINVMEKSAVRELQMKLAGTKHDLLRVFAEKDPDNTELLPLSVWCECVEQVLKLQLPWRLLSRQLTRVTAEGKVAYKEMFDKGSVANNQNVEDSVMESLYKNKQNLETIYRLMDVDKSGRLSFEEFEQGCLLLAQHTGQPMKPETIRKLALSMDKDQDGEIDLNEFMEGIRLIDQVGERNRSTTE